MKTIHFQVKDNISETLVIPLYFRAVESRRPDGMIKDKRAEALVDQLDVDFSQMKLMGHDQVTTIMRLREFDRFAREFLTRNPDGVVVHVGCGLDTRFERVDNGQVTWFDLDLPDVIELRRQLLGETGERHHLLGASVLEPGWLEAVRACGKTPVLLMAEGVFPYFEEEQVKAIFLAVREAFPAAEVVCDAMTPFMIFLDNFHFIGSPIKARLHWGMKTPGVVETWAEGIKNLEAWYYFDRPEPRIQSMQWMKYIPALSRGVGIFHFRLSA
ncbi:MAG TPA: class I SAM-dependent methyltransferase [Anaerolineaceae bacterium]|nr:class I SAM-dependent methyltransferase [Anaerolineaceae bacterium]HPN54143.1 class I SAM-dependent methyltransferase [Anaerolineaceae bacterium]